MTNASDTHVQFANAPSREPRSTRTLRLQLLMDQQQKLAIGARIKDLRERSPYTQEALADRLGVSLRGYQRMEETGGIKYANVEKLAHVHEVDVDYILRGTLEKAPAPDLSRSDQLAEIERKLDDILDWISNGGVAAAVREEIGRSVEEAVDRLPELASTRGRTARTKRPTRSR